mmetsp:Transcript_88743/g.251507  ORF Transcript_88743/g.251507 Transcript_88743/m.251507 type:complete len:210 (-) Transcript_88743:410-1039(-)
MPCFRRRTSSPVAKTLVGMWPALEMSFALNTPENRTSLLLSLNLSARPKSPRCTWSGHLLGAFICMKTLSGLMSWWRSPAWCTHFTWLASDARSGWLGEKQVLIRERALCTNHFQRSLPPGISWTTMLNSCQTKLPFFPRTQGKRSTSFTIPWQSRAWSMALTSLVQLISRRSVPPFRLRKVFMAKLLSPLISRGWPSIFTAMTPSTLP